jgi:hypothetical protein
MDQCSDYIKVRRIPPKIECHGNNRKNEWPDCAVKSKQFVENELAAFLKFRQFLQLFPTFIPEFSALLIDDDAIQLKEGELLNTELRILHSFVWASKTAQKFRLFYGIQYTTIYNYRSQLKNKARVQERILKLQ